MATTNLVLPYWLENGGRFEIENLVSAMILGSCVQCSPPLFDILHVLDFLKTFHLVGVCDLIARESSVGTHFRKKASLPLLHVLFLSNEQVDDS
jgi:hypothetical protein